MARLPRVSGRQTIRALQRAGFVLVRTRGSHHMLRKEGSPARKVSVPVHGSRDLPPGTLRSILGQAGLSVEAFIDLL